MNRREQLASIFRDTEKLLAENPQLKAASELSASASVFHDADEWPELAEPSREGVVRVSGCRSFEAARAILSEHPETRVCVHNFASPTTPGGGVVNGSSAQEESLCRCSTLYPVLNQRRFWSAYYTSNRNSRNPLATDACIYSPGVVVFKSDESLPARLPEDEWYQVDVITCAAPNLRNMDAARGSDGGRAREVPLTELSQIHVRRARHLLALAASHGADALVVGAFGCGAFANDPYLVAEAWHQAVEEYRHHFALIEFAVFHMPYESTNYEAFREELA